ncbi:hypothetical protein ACQ4LE_006884 [Meloidogyne hapla]|uniref:Uncharacterized protein n=1 Tax=Meloidogyne hapla TaxID=6305 RepID=A0A1I8BJZ7_MELHA
MPPDLINAPQKKALSSSKKAIKNAQIMPDNRNGVLTKAKADKADKNNISPTKKIGIKIKEEIMEVNNDVKNDFSKKLQNLQKESLTQETTKKTKSVTKKRKLINIKEENDSSLNQSPNNNNVAANEFNPLDNILNEIDAFDTSNKPKNKKKREKLIKIESPSDVESGNAPCSSQQLPPTPLPSSANRPLNKIELARQEHDNSMVQTFLHKDDLMERILAYKMLRGRVESYLTMKAKIDLNTCITPEYEIRPDLVDPVSDRLHPKLEAIIKQESNEAIEEEEHPLPPPFPPPPLFDSSSSFVPPPPPSLIPSEGALSQALHGPMTPPGSPGTNQSSLSANNGNNQQQKNHQQEMFPCTSDTLMTNEEMVPPPKQPKLEKSESNSTNEELFKKFGGLPEHQISTFFGVDLKKYGDLQFDELLATFRESLAKHLSEKEKKKQESSSKSPAASGGHVERLQPQQRQQQTSQEQQSLLNVSNELEAAMEISSTSSSSLGVFLPPPPAPPPMLYNNNSMPSTSREAVEDEGKSPVLVSDTSISPQQQIKPPTPLFPQGQQLVFTRPPPPFSTTIIPKGKPLPISQNQLPQQFLHPPPQIETGGRCQILISESSIFQPQQQKRPPSLFSQVPLVFSTPPPFIPTTTMVTPFTTPPPRFPHRQRLPPPSQHQQQFLHPPPRPLLSCKEAEVKETKNSILSPDSIIIPQHKQQKLPSLFSKCQLVFPRPPPIPTSLAAPPQLPLNHHPPQQLHSSTLSRETSGNEAKSRILSPESTITPQQRLPPPPPFPQVPLVFTTPPPPIPATTPRVASPQIPPLHQQTPQSQQFLHPPSSVPSQNDILKTVVQAINIGKSKENNKVKCSISPEKDDPATTTVEGNTKPYGKFF